MSRILTLEQAQMLLDARSYVCTVWIGDYETDNTAVFFTDYHGVRNIYGFKTWVPGTTHFTNGILKVVERPGLENGLITNIQEYIFVFERDAKILLTEQEVIDFRKTLP